MSDHDDVWRRPDGDIPPPPPPPPAPPIDPLAPAAVEQSHVRRGGLGARVGAIALGALLLVGGVAFAATQVGGSGGNDSPEDAVAQMLDALSDEDLLGVLASLDPGERDTLRQPAEDLFAELERLEVVDDSFELTGIDGLDLAFSDVTYRTEPIVDGLARVYVTGGRASFAVDGRELPVGDFLADALERFGVDPADLQESDAEDDLASDDTFLVARDTGDGWRVSIGYTAVEAARGSMGAPVPATGMQAIGAASPEEAVEGLLRSATALDLRGAVGRLSPHEFAALHHYWPVLVDEADLPSADDLGVSVELTDLELDADTDGDRARVFIRSIGVDVVAEDFAGGGTVADGCVVLRGDALAAAQEELGLDDDTICRDDIQGLLEDAMDEAGAMSGMGIGGLEDLMGAGLDAEQPAFGITTTKIDGQWYVAPIRTFADLGTAALRTVEREDLEAAVDAVEELFGGGFFGGGMLGGGFMPPGLTDEFGDFDDGGWSEYEEFEDIGEPIGGDPQGVLDPGTERILSELAQGATGDPEAAQCVLAQLQRTDDAFLLFELADAHRYEFEPSAEAQDLFFAALEACGG